jgi:hypothetical protein
VKRGLADIDAGRTEDADTAIARLQWERKPPLQPARPASGVADPRGHGMQRTGSTAAAR